MNEIQALHDDGSNDLDDLDEVLIPNTTHLIQGIALVVRGMAFTTDEWAYVFGALDYAGWSVVEANSVASARRTAAALQPEIALIDALPALGATPAESARSIESIAEVAPATGIGVIAAAWAMTKEMEAAIKTTRAAFFGYATKDFTYGHVLWKCATNGRSRFTRTEAEKIGIEIQ